MPGVMAYATTGSHRARAQSAVADGARARNRTRRVHGINATSVTAHKPPFPYLRITLLISIRLSVTKFLPEQRVDQDGMIQLLDRSSTSTSTSTSMKNSQNKTMHRSGRSAALNLRNHFGGHSVMVAVLAYAATGSHRARAQSAVADGARARNRTLRVHGINATSVTAHKPPFPYSRIMLLISIRLSVTKFLPDQRVDQDGMIQLLDRSSTSTSTSTKNSQNITIYRSGRSAALNLRNHFGGCSVTVAVRRVERHLFRWNDC
jgi:hypothetical protein